MLKSRFFLVVALLIIGFCGAGGCFWGSLNSFFPSKAAEAMKDCLVHTESARLAPA